MRNLFFIALFAALAVSSEAFAYSHANVNVTANIGTTSCCQTTYYYEGCNTCCDGYTYNYGSPCYYYGRTAYSYPYGNGRYPLVPFAAPVRRAFGLPGFTPVRQFLFGRGRERRMARRGWY